MPYKLPFKVNDGKTTRPCTYEDLRYIMEFMLPFTLYSKHRRFKILWRDVLDNDILIVMYACLKAFSETRPILPYSYLGSISFIDRSRIGVIKCKELHKWKNNKYAKLMLGIM